MESSAASEKSPIMQFSTKSVQAAIGKLASSRNTDPTISSGVEIRKPSLMAIKYLFLPIADASGISSFSNLSISKTSLFHYFCFAFFMMPSVVLSTFSPFIIP